MIRLLLTFLCLASLSAMEEGLKIRIPQAEQTVRVSIEEEANIQIGRASCRERVYVLV